LLDAGLTKAQIREVSRRWGLSTWDKPAAACLSSRIAYGVEVTAHRLARVERAETAVRSTLEAGGQPVGNLRVRDLGDLARVEVDLPVLDALHADEALRREVLAVVQAAGFTHAELDSKGFRSGSMNELLADPARFR
jgi:uncharacterized protein